MKKFLLGLSEFLKWLSEMSSYTEACFPTQFAPPFTIASVTNSMTDSDLSFGVTPVAGGRLVFPYPGKLIGVV